MEENNKKIIEMEGQSNGSKKMSYEQLENIAHQLSEQVRQLYARLQTTTMDNTFRRLDYLFKVVANKESFSLIFVNECVREIEELMTIPTESSEEDLEDNKEG